MEKVILGRRGMVFRWDRPLRFAGECLALAGMTALVPVVFGRPPPVIVWFWPAAVVVAAIVPVKALVADRNGVSLGYGRERRTIGWDRVTRVLVEGRGRITVVGARTPPEAAAPAPGLIPDLLDRLPVAVGRPRVRGDRPFAIEAEAAVAGAPGGRGGGADRCRDHGPGRLRPSLLPHTGIAPVGPEPGTRGPPARERGRRSATNAYCFGALEANSVV